MTRFGDFWKPSVANVLTKVAQIYKSLSGLFWKHQFSSNYCRGYFWGNFGKNLATFYFSIWSHWCPLRPSTARTNLLKPFQEKKKEIFIVHAAGYASVVPLLMYSSQRRQPNQHGNKKYLFKNTIVSRSQVPTFYSFEGDAYNVGRATPLQIFTAAYFFLIGQFPACFSSFSSF